MKRLLFYITGHGFGHATRSIDVINKLCSKDGEIVPVISTRVPKWLFEQQVKADFEYVRCKNSIGVVQKDWRGADKLETLRQYSLFIEAEPGFIRQQVNFIKANNVAAIISDISAAAFLVAQKADIPSFAITNFSWDWIYEPYAKEYPQYQFVVDHIRRCYGLADCLLRLPFYGDLSAFPVIEDIPLVAIRSTATKAEVAAKLKLQADKKIILLYLGNFDYGKVLSEEVLRGQDYHFMTPQMYQNCELPFQDLLKAAEVVVTKPGYGIVSECIANQTAIMYTKRQDFLEHYALVAGIKEFAHNHLISQKDLFGGRLIEHLDELLGTEFSWPPIAVNGAEIAADRILRAI